MDAASALELRQLEVKEALTRLEHEKSALKNLESEARDAEDEALLLEASVLKHERRAEARRAAAVDDSKVTADLLGLIVYSSAPQDPGGAPDAASDAGCDAGAADAAEIERLRGMVEETLHAAEAFSTEGASFPARDAYDAAFALIAAATERCEAAAAAAAAAETKYDAIKVQTEVYDYERQKALGESEEEMVAMAVMCQMESNELQYEQNYEMNIMAGMPDMMMEELLLVPGFSRVLAPGGGLTVEAVEAMIDAVMTDQRAIRAVRDDALRRVTEAEAMRDLINATVAALDAFGKDLPGKLKSLMEAAAHVQSSWKSAFKAKVAAFGMVDILRESCRNALPLDPALDTAIVSWCDKMLGNDLRGCGTVLRNGTLGEFGGSPSAREAALVALMKRLEGDAKGAWERINARCDVFADEESQLITDELKEEAERYAQASAAARVKLADLLPTHELYETVKDVRVTFSFGSRMGGLDLAVSLRAKLVEQWGPGTAYVDLVDLRSHHNTHTIDVTLPSGKLITKVINPHWAEFYYMTMVLTETVVLILDKAWTDSSYCLGEWQLFLRNMNKTHRDAATGERKKSYYFRFVVIYDVSATGGVDPASEERARETLRSLGVTEPAAMIPAIVDGEASRLLDADAEVAFMAAMEAGKAERSAILAADEAEGHPRMDENMLRLACCVTYDRHWRGLAQRLLNGEQWWQSSGEDGPPMYTAANFPKEWELFSKIDANHDGSLDREEIRVMLQQGMGWDDYADDLCHELDADGDGLVSFAEFVIGFQRFCDTAFALGPHK